MTSALPDTEKIKSNLSAIFGSQVVFNHAIYDVAFIKFEDVQNCELCLFQIFSHVHSPLHVSG